MPSVTTLANAFAFFGTVPRNPRWAWSAVSPDGQTVAVTIWDHKLKPDGSVDYFDPAKRSLWMNRLGNRDRIRNLRHALEHCDGKFRVVRVIAKDPKAEPKRIKDRIADPHTIMQIIRFDEETGEFTARPI